MAEALLFSNGKRIDQELLADGDGRLVGRLKQTAAPAEQIDLAVRNVLSRPPDDEERAHPGAYLEQRTDRPEDACRQLVWALLTCPNSASTIDRRAASSIHHTADPPERNPMAETRRPSFCGSPDTPSIAAASSAPWPPAPRRSPRT